jgi:2-oxoglutarate ferredoxin oxidoreductase subunit beta
VARSVDTDKAHLTGVLRRAAEHEGSVFVEIYQNCNVYNDGAFDAVRDDKSNRIQLEHGEPIRFGGDDGTIERGVVSRPGGGVEIVDVESAGEDALLRHDERAEDSALAFALSRLSHTPVGPTPIGIFRAVERPVYDTLMAEQIEVTKRELGEGDLEKLLHAGDTWHI